VKGILADVHIKGPIDDLVRQMQTGPWADFWQHLALTLYHFDDVGLTPTSTDLEIWHCCQARQLIFITNNRNEDSPDSLEATIRQHNKAGSLPVFTIGDLNRFRLSRNYVERVVERLYEYLLRIDEVCGTGRLYLP
jgi:predicted nuclease of predicted toxin-antitoxin system